MRTNPDKMCKLEKRMKEQSKQDVLEQVEVLKALRARVTLDCEQIKIILNFIEDKLSKVDSGISAKRVKGLSAVLCNFCPPKSKF